MRRGLSALVVASAFGLLLGGAPAARAQQPVGQPSSEGHPHKWLAIDKSMADLIGDGFEVKTVVYDNSETAPKAEPDVHYFLQKTTILVRCDFRKRDQASIYWCFQLTKSGKP